MHPDPHPALQQPARTATDARPHVLDATMFWSATGGGVRRYLLAKRDWLQHCAHWRHTLLAPGAVGPGCVDCGGLPLPRSGGYRLPLSRRRAAGLMVQQQPDLIEVADPYRLSWAALDAGQRLGVPALAFCHSDLGALAARAAGGAVRARWARVAAEAYLAHVYAEFDLVLAPSRSMVQVLRDIGVRQARRQPLGVDCALFHPSRRDPAWRISHGLRADTRVLLYAGRFAPEKNLPLLVEAVRRLGPRYLLVAVGDGPVPPQGPQVLRLPHQPVEGRLARLLASVDVFVHAGDQETFGLAALEAMACGTPVVVRDAAGLGELVRGGAGFAVPSDRPSDWAEAIAALFACEREAWAGAARVRALMHDWRLVLPTLLARYQRLIDERRSGGADALAAPMPHDATLGARLEDALLHAGSQRGASVSRPR